MLDWAKRERLIFLERSKAPKEKRRIDLIIVGVACLALYTVIVAGIIQSTEPLRAVVCGG